MFPFDPNENIRKPLVFRCYQGGSKRNIEKKRIHQRLEIIKLLLRFVRADTYFLALKSISQLLL